MYKGVIKDYNLFIEMLRIFLLNKRVDFILFYLDKLKNDVWYSSIYRLKGGLFYFD